MDIIDKLKKYNFSFQFNENDIYLTIYPENEAKLITEKDIRDALCECEDINKYAKFYFLSQNLENALKAQKNLQGPLTVKIFERRDAVIKIDINDNNLEAYLTIIPPYGGKEVKEIDIYNALEQNGIKYGINEQLIKEAVEKGYCSRYPIASGVKPIDGQDASFEILYTEPPNKGTPRVLDDGRVDFHDLGILTKVSKGDKLLRKIPPTKGKPGIKVTGEQISGKDGKDRKLVPGKGSIISEEDPNILIATMSGQPRFKGNTVDIEPIIELEEIGVSTGDIDFSGTVIVKKNVNLGYKVKCDGDLIVNDTVEGSEILSKGYVYIKNGLIGGPNSKILVGKNFISKFVENTVIKAHGSIFISDVVLYSNLNAFDRIEVGDSQGKGQIIGGSTRALYEVKCKILGSPGGTHTFVEVGTNPYLNDYLNQIRNSLEHYKKRLNELVKNIIYFKMNNKTSDDKYMLLEQEREMILIKLNELIEEENIVKEKLQNKVNARIIVTDYIYSGVKIKIYDYIKVFNTDCLGGTFYIKDNEIIIS